VSLFHSPKEQKGTRRKGHQFW